MAHFVVDQLLQNLAVNSVPLPDENLALVIDVHLGVPRQAESHP